MTTTRKILALALLSGLLTLTACGGTAESTSTDRRPAISGRIEGGLRVLTLDPTDSEQHFRIYRGDYVRPERTDGTAFTFEVPDLSVALSFPVAEGQRPYFKVPDVGVFRFTSGDGGGVIEAVNLTAAAYSDMTAREALDFITAEDPIVLDVRTPSEFASGHLENATLIPVQRLQLRLGELADDKERPVFVYCRSGNRSTVAAKLLLDAGHKQVVNLRRGIVEWHREGLPIVH